MTFQTTPSIRTGSIAAVVCLVAIRGGSHAQMACEVAHVAPDDPLPFQRFGEAVDVSGNAAVAGASWDNENGAFAGAAYVFRFDGTSWVQEQKLLPLDGNSDDQFGWSVAIDGDTALVGAPGHTDGRFAGTVYVYRFDGGRWVELQELFVSEPPGGIGQSVCINGNLLMVGAQGDEQNGPGAGAAYVFRFDSKTEQWIEEQKLVASDAALNGFFGHAMAIAGDVAAITATHASACGTLSGAACVFRYDRTILRWVQEQALTASDCEPFEAFGQSIATDGARVLVGSEEHRDTGAVYMFRYDADASMWVEDQRLIPSDGQVNDQFGQSVALKGDTALIGAFVSDEVGPSFGAAYMFRFDGSRWVEQQKLLPDPGAWTAFYGKSVAISGDTAVIGAHGENTGAGSVYVYAGLSGVDCNTNGRSDSCDIAFDRRLDSNSDGVPDDCQCPWDLDVSGATGINDLLRLLGAWGMDPGGPPDFDGNGAVGISDLLDLLANWGPCP